MSTTLRLYEQGSPESWRELMLTNIGKEKMDTIRSLSNDLLTLETAKVARDRESINQTLLLNRIGVTTMTALSLLALFMYLRQTAALDRQRGEQQNVVQAERDQLEVEVAAPHRAARPSSRCTCRRCARTSAATSPASCTTSSARC